MIYPWLSQPYKHLARRLSDSSLHHALILVGPEGIGKKELSSALSLRMLCKQAVGICPCGQCQSCRLLNVGHHPDLYVLAPETTSIGVDAVREKRQMLMGKSQLSGNKVLVIENAHLMTESAANSLLKILEEPPQGTYIVILTDQYQRLLPTIVSRCEQHILKRPNNQEIRHWLATEGYSEVTDVLIELFDNAPLKIKVALNNGTEERFLLLKAQVMDLLANRLDAFSIAKQWKGDEHQTLVWCQKIMQELARNGYANAWQRFQKLTAGVSDLQKTGINQQLLLCDILHSLRS